MFDVLPARHSAVHSDRGAVCRERDTADRGPPRARDQLAPDLGGRGRKSGNAAIGGLGGCPFAQEALVGNIPTESVIEALRQRELELTVRKSLGEVLTINANIASDYQ